MKHNKIYIFSIIVILASCGRSFVRNTEARDEDQEMLLAIQSQKNISHQITASIETTPVDAVSPNDDSADDPAIWYQKSKPDQSLIFGSNKKGGIHSYTLDGSEIQFIPCGKVNNIDIRQSVDIGGGKMDIIAGSNRTNNSIILFQIDEDGKMNQNTATEYTLGTFEPYGFCLYASPTGQLYAFVNSKTGEIRQYEFTCDNTQKFTGKLIRTLKLETQVEGMVADDAQSILYVGEEQYGIFKFDANPLGVTKGQLLDQSKSDANTMIKYDIEGLALLPPHYLLASSQGNFSYAIFDTQTDDYVTSFKIMAGSTDAVEETDGIEILNVNLGSQFPQGIMIAQDGFNYDKYQKLENQNFKVIDLKWIYEIIDSSKTNNKQ